MKTARGFTLIELLVVIAIIGILASLAVANYLTAQQRARDAQRKSDLKQLQNALQLYYNDNGKYPIVTNCCQALTSVTGLNPNYIKLLPSDPNGDGTYYRRYNYDNQGACPGSPADGSDQKYRVWAYLENKSDPGGTDGCGNKSTALDNGNRLYLLHSP